MNAADVSIAAFHAKVSGHLTEALRRVPDSVPHDVFDPAISPMMEELDALDEYLFDLGSEERDREASEERTSRQVAAKRKDATLEDRAMRLDHAVQRAMDVLGVEHASFFLAPMRADMVVDAFVRFLDALPAHAFTPSRPIPPDFPASRDATVAGIIALMHERKVRS